jgi:hypothetical protein
LLVRRPTTAAFHLVVGQATNNGSVSFGCWSGDQQRLRFIWLLVRRPTTAAFYLVVGQAINNGSVSFSCWSGDQQRQRFI